MHAGKGSDRFTTVSWPLAAVIAATIIAIAVSLYYMRLGRYTVFQNLFYLPMIIACIYYLKRGFAFSVLLTFFYFFLITVHATDSIIVREALVRGLILIIVAGVVTFISLRRRQAEEEHRKLRLWREGVNRILGSLLAPVPFEERLKQTTDGVVETFGADFCRIWLIDNGDLCDADCMHAELKEGPHVCLYRDRCLHLKASSGRYTHIDGKAHRRVPFGAYKIGRIASGEDKKFLTNDVQHDPRVHNHEWAKGLGLKAFAGYRLKPPDGETIGVFALFAGFEISPDMDAVLEGLSQSIALAVQKDIVERTLAESENRYRAVVEDQIELICRFRTDGTLTFVNDVFCKYFAVRGDDIVGARWQPRACPEDIPEIEQKLKLLSSAEPVVVIENRIYDGSGNIRWMQFINRGLFDEGGCLKEIQAVGRDITDHRRIEQRLNREIELKDFLIDLYKTAPAMTDKELYDYVLNHVVCMSDSAIGFFHLVSDDQKEVILTAWNAEALKNCTASYATHYTLEQAGNWVDCVRIRGPVVYNDFPHSPNQKGLPEGHTPVRRFMSVPVIEHDRVRMIFGVGNKAEDYSEFDVTLIQVVANDLQRFIVQRRLEKALSYSEAYFRSLIENSSDIITILNVDGDVRYISPSLQRVTGLRPAALTGCSIFEYIHPDDVPGATDIFVRTMQSPEVTLYGEIRLRHSDDSWHVFEIAVQNLLDKEAVKGIVINSRDITDRKQAEAERENLISKLQKAFSEVKTLSGLLPICASCKKIRNDEGYWEQIEKYVGERSTAEFSHGICPECEEKLYPELFKEK